MRNWTNVNEIISNFKQKRSVSKHIALNIIQDFLKERFNLEERVDLGIKNGTLEIKSPNSIIAQEIFLRKEELKESINDLLKRVQKERRIDFSDFFIKEIVSRMK